MTQHPAASWCEIRLRGHLHPRWAATLDGLTIRAEADGTTRLTGPVADQAALHGVLTRFADLGIPLISVTCTPCAPAGSAPAACSTTPERNDHDHVHRHP